MKTLIALIIILTTATASISNLISDRDFTNTIEPTRIKVLIKSYPGNRLTDDQVNFIIMQSRYYDISPLLVLSILEKESGIISNPVAGRYLWRLHRCMGYGLYIKRWIAGKKYYKYGGFYLQVGNGIRILRKYLDRWNNEKIVYLKCINKKIKPANAPTYSLYKYNPFYGIHSTYGTKSQGNRAIKIIFKRFKKRLEGKI